MAEPASNTQELLAREAGRRPRAAAGAVVSALLTLGGSIVAGVLFSDYPRVLLIDAVRDAAGEPIPGRAGLRTAQVLFYEDHAASLIAIAAVLALGALALILPLSHLYKATRARRPQTPNVALVMAVAGPVALAVSEIALQGGILVRSHDFATSADQSSAAAHDVFRSDIIVAGQFLRQAAVIALGFAFVVVCLNAMRAGLLTRFMGILGIIVGALFVIPIGSPLPIVQTFWLIALAVLLAGRWPNGVPPAWQVGEAVPWPSSQDLRDARARANPPSAGEQGPPKPSGEAGTQRREKQSGRPHPASKKKRRRR